MQRAASEPSEAPFGAGVVDPSSAPSGSDAPRRRRRRRANAPAGDVADADAGGAGAEREAPPTREEGRTSLVTEEERAVRRAARERRAEAARESGAPSAAAPRERAVEPQREPRPAPSRSTLPPRARRGGRRRRRDEDEDALGEVAMPPGWDDDVPLDPPPPSGTPVIVPAGDIPRERVDIDALRVTTRLARRGFQAYLVGGCVRDLLLGLDPKDFDVATAAHPRQIKRVFRNGRIIGRRFKLVHVVYGDKVVETSTFRAEPKQVAGEEEDLLILDDNVFGNAEEDARRRDFTINALFLDPLEWRLLDYVGGLDDLGARLLRTIGEPQVRLGEDPVRILRAIKFATRLGFRIEQGTWDAMCRWSPELERSAPPRVAEEVLRLLRSGHAEAAFRLLHQCGALRVVLPAVGDHVADPQRAEAFWPLLAALDREHRSGREPDVALALALLYWRPVVERLGRELDEPPFAEGEILDVAGDLLEPMIAATRLSRRDVGLARRLLANQRRFTQPSSKRYRPLLFMHSPEFPLSLELLRLSAEARGEDLDVVELWAARYAEARQVDAQEVDALRARRRRRRRRS